MPKTFRVDFSKGVNVVTDKALQENGWVTVADNVDLRSGAPAPFKMPVQERTAPQGTTCIYEYRGQFYLSSDYRDYVSEFVNGSDRTYYTPYGGEARKIVSGQEAPLGIAVPKLAPSVKTTGSLLPAVTLSLSSATTRFKDGQSRYYRVAVETANGIQPASAEVAIEITSDGQSVTLTWNAILGAKAYWIFGADTSGKAARLSVLSSTSNSFTDDGTIVGSDTATNYDVDNPYSYIYTFEREIQGMLDESGPSPLSSSVSTTLGKSLLFDVLGDGFFDQEGALQINKLTATVTPSGTYYTPVTISCATYNPMLQQITFTTASVHHLAAGDKVRLQGFSDLNWNGKDVEVFPVTTLGVTTPGTEFVVRNMPVPVETYTDAKHTITINKTLVELATAPSTPVATDDAVYANFVGCSSTVTPGCYKAVALTSTAFTLAAYTDGTPVLASDMRFVPANGGIKTRNLYRTGDASGYYLVKKIPVEQSVFVDDYSATRLGGAPSSYYDENGITVIFAPPPPGLLAITAHYGMLFGIVGNRVRWTPLGQPDAWPEAFYVELPYTPLALVSYGQALIVLCQEGVYRLDGNEPTRMSLSQTRTVDGCVAPYSVQKVAGTLVYLSARGLMAFDGNDSVCITDGRLPASFILGPSGASEVVHHWWHPTLDGYNYASLTQEDGSFGAGVTTFPLAGTAPPPMTRDIRSFTKDGKYFLYYTNESGYYPVNTMLCVDMQVAGAPITTLGLKVLDAHVSNTGDVYLLTGDPTALPADVLSYFEMMFAYSGMGMHYIAAWTQSEFTAPTPLTGSFSLGASPSSVTLTQRGSTTSQITLYRSSFANPVTLAVSGVPEGCFASISPPTLSGGTLTATLTITSTSVTPGTYFIAVAGTSGSLTNSTSVALNITSSGIFSLSLDMDDSLPQGLDMRFTVDIARGVGFTGPVTVALGTQLMTGLTVAFDNATTLGDTITGTLTAGTQGPTGPFVFMVRGTSGDVAEAAQKTITITSALRPPPFIPAVRMATTNALIAWDCSISSYDQVIIPNLVGDTNYNGRKGGYQAYNLNRFSRTSTYKTSAGGVASRLGVAKTAGTLAEWYTSPDIMEVRVWSTATAINSGIDTDYTSSLPIQTVCMVLYQSTYSAGDTWDIFKYAWSRVPTSGFYGTATSEFVLRKYGKYLQVIAEGDTGTPVISVDLTTNHDWDFDIGAVFVAVSVSIAEGGVATFNLWVNRTVTSGTYSYATTSTPDPTNVPVFGLTMGRSGAYSGTASNVYGCFEFVAYTDVKDIVFIRQCALTWGF